MPGALVGRVVLGALGEGQVVQREHEGHVARQRQRRGGGDPGHVEPAADQAVQARAPGERPGAEGQPSRDAARHGLDPRRRGVEPVAEDEQAPRVLREPGRQRAGERGRVVRDAPPRLHAGEAAAVDADDHRAGNVPPVQAIDSAPYMEEGNGSISRGARVALVHDFLLDLRGAERVFAAICDTWPDADVFTAVYDERGTEGRFANRDVQHVVPPARCGRPPRTFRPLLPLYPYAIESFDLCGYDLVVSTLERVGARGPRRRAAPPTSATATTRSATRGTSARRRSPSRGPLRARRPAVGVQPLAPVGLDRRPARRPLRRRTPRLTRRRIKRYYGREATVLHPPVETVPLRSRPGRRLLPGASPSSCSTSASTWRSRPSTACGCRWSSSETVPTRGACAGSRARRSASRAGPPTTRVAELMQRRQGAGRDGDRGVRDRRRRGPGRGAAGHRAGRGRRARDRGRGRDRRVLRAPRAGRAGRGGARRSTRWRSTRRPASSNAGASASPGSARALRASCPDALARAARRAPAAPHAPRAPPRLGA